MQEEMFPLDCFSHHKKQNIFSQKYGTADKAKMGITIIGEKQADINWMFMLISQFIYCSC